MSKTISYTEAFAMNWDQLYEANAALDLHNEAERRAYEQARKEAEAERKRKGKRA